MLLSRNMPPCVPRLALVLVPLAAILLSSSHAALLPDNHPNHSAQFAGATNLHSTHPSTRALNTNAPANHDDDNNDRIELPTQRLVPGEHRSPTVKSVLRQADDRNASDGLDQFFSSMQPPATNPTSESTANEGAVIQVEEQLSPSPSEMGPVIVVDSETPSNSVNGDNRDVDVPTAPATDIDDVPKPTESVEMDDEPSPSPEVEEGGENIVQMETRGQPVSTVQEAEFQIDSNVGNANQSPTELFTEEDEPEPSPSLDDAGVIPTLLGDSDAPGADNEAEGSGSPTPSPSETSTDGSGKSVAPLAAASTSQNETSRVQADLSVRSTSVTTVSQDFDAYVREYLASQTDTAPEEWKPVSVSAAEEIEERGTTFFVWGLKYQGILSSSDLDGDVKRLQERIFSGGLDAFLRSSLDTDDISVQLFNNIQRDVQDKPEVTIEGIGAVSSKGQPTSNENAATGGNPEISESTNDVDGSNTKNLRLILGTSLGFVAVLALGGAAVVLGKRTSNSPRHTIDGEEMVPPTLTSFHSITTTDSTPSRFQTGAPVNPRGATVLRNQSRLLDWRAEQAAAADRESRVEILE